MGGALKMFTCSKGTIRGKGTAKVTIRAGEENLL